MLIFLLLYYIKAVNVISIDLMTQSKCIGLVIGLQKKKTLYNIDIQGLKFNLVGVRRLYILYILLFINIYIWLTKLAFYYFLAYFYV